MTRVAKTVKTEIDITKPLAAELQDNGSCYGKLYNPQAKECSLCADSVTCAVHFQKLLLENIRNREKEEGMFLDMQDFSRVPKDKFLQALQNKKETSVQNAVRVIAHYAQSKDEIACLRFLTEFTKENKLLIKEGIIYAD